MTVSLKKESQGKRVVSQLKAVSLKTSHFTTWVNKVNVIKEILMHGLDATQASGADSRYQARINTEGKCQEEHPCYKYAS